MIDRKEDETTEEKAHWQRTYRPPPKKLSITQFTGLSVCIRMQYVRLYCNYLGNQLVSHII